MGTRRSCKLNIMTFHFVLYKIIILDIHVSYEIIDLDVYKDIEILPRLSRRFPSHIDPAMPPLLYEVMNRARGVRNGTLLISFQMINRKTFINIFLL